MPHSCKASRSEHRELRALGVRRIADPSQIKDDEVAIRATSGAVVKFLAVPKKDEVRSFDGICNALAQLDRRTWRASLV